MDFVALGSSSLEGPLKLTTMFNSSDWDQGTTAPPAAARQRTGYDLNSCSRTGDHLTSGDSSPCLQAQPPCIVDVRTLDSEQLLQMPKLRAAPLDALSCTFANSDQLPLCSRAQTKLQSQRFKDGPMI